MVGPWVLAPDGVGSSPTAPALGDWRNLVARLHGMQKVVGSNPTFSTKVHATLARMLNEGFTRLRLFHCSLAQLVDAPGSGPGGSRFDS